ncbi:MAG: low molecular weight phosphotyrosine protein phosphatase [Treponema sp.]|nr:low molecular weight phosphotyrosine protein phosphatase [Treponema sp.]
MHKILFICHGNICRSPMAEMVMKHLVKKAGRESEFYIDSAATDYDEIGNGMHRGTRQILTQNGIPFTDHRARLVTPDDYNDFDLLIIMDEENERHLKRRVGEDSEGKIHYLLEYANIYRDVADPWYTGNFEETWHDVLLGCRSLLDHLHS